MQEVFVQVTINAWSEQIARIDVGTYSTNSNTFLSMLPDTEM
jgi:hypothetical protein